MASNNPTVIAAHLDDKELRASIDSLVNYFNEKLGSMVTTADKTVTELQTKLKSIGDIKGGGTSGGTAKLVEDQKKLKASIDDSKLSYDRFEQGVYAASRNETLFTTIDTQIALMKEDLKTAEQQVVAFREMARRGAETGDKGLFVFATTNLHQQEEEVARLSQQISNLTSQRQALKDMLAPQGDAFKNYVDSLSKVNPELASLNAQYKQGVSLLQNQTTATQQTTQSVEQQTEKEEQRVAKIREEWELEQRLHAEQGKQFETQNEINRQLEIANAKTAENLAFQERINAARQAKESGESKRTRETNELTGAIAGLLGIQEKEVAVTNVESASQHRLTNYLKQLTTAYQRLDKEGMSASHGKMLADEIQRVNRELREMTRLMNRPTSLKNAMGLDERTLDNIVLKIQQLNAYRGGLNITDPKQVQEMKTVETEIDRLKKKQDELMGKNAQMISSNNALARSWNYMKNRLAFYFTVGASTQFVKNLIEVRSQYEMNERALGILIDSAERGTQIFNELSQMALVSPYTLIELSSAAKQLSAYDVAANDLVDTTRRLADISAAVGLPVERLTTALGQIKAFEHLTSMTARRFSSAGIPLIKALADHFTELEGKMVSVGDVYDRIKKKAVGYNDVMQVITEMTDEGGKFFDFQAKMADTLKVQLANLTLAWNNMLNDIGKSEQGIIVGGIKGLKELFLQWKNIEKALRNVAIAFGVVKLAQLAYYLIVRKTNKEIALHYILGNKMSRGLKEMAVSFRNAKDAITGASAAMKSFVAWTAGILAVTALAVELGMTWHDAEEGVKEFNKAIREGAAENQKNISQTLEQYKDLRDSLYKTEKILVAPKTSPRGKDVYEDVTTPVDINEAEAKKVWEAMREEIELSSDASETYISRLMQIENVSERLRQGFVLLDDLQTVNAALAEMGDKTIFIQQDWSSWWNLWLAPDSFKENLQDFLKAKKQIEDAYGDIETAREKLNKATSVGDKNLKSGVSRYDQTLSTFRANLKETTDDLIDFISLKGWTGDTNKINELFAQFTNKTITQLGLDPNEAFTLQLEIEEARSQAVKQSLQIRLADEKQALKAARDEEAKKAIQTNIDRLTIELRDFDKNNGRGRVLWENYTKWMTEQHKSEMTQMFRDMDTEDIKSINFQEGKWKEFAERTAQQYAKEHKLSYNDAFTLLQKWVKNANMWSIFIPLAIRTEDNKTVEEQLNELDAMVDKADASIKRLTTRINELKAKQKLSKEETKEFAKAEKERAQAEQDKADAEAKGGHGKQETKDSKAADKARKQAESELQKALKEELSLIDKVRSAYKSLTKEGVGSAEAIKEATDGLDESVAAINKTFSKFGLTTLDLTKYAGVQNPREIMDMLQAQLDKLISSGKAKPSEIKDLQVKIRDLKLDSITFDQKKITDSLNNELSKIKEEYELAVELDANPELGDMFAQMFGIDTSTFPKTIDEYMQRVQAEFDKNTNLRGIAEPLDVLKASADDWRKWAESVGMSEEALKDFSAKFIDAQGVAKKWATDTIKQTQDLQYKFADVNGKIAIETEKLEHLRQKLANETNEEQRRLLELQIQDQENAIAKLGEEVMQMLPIYKNLFNSIAEHSASVTRRIAKQWKEALENAEKNPDGTYTITDSISGEKATITKKEYGTQLDKVNGKLRETQSVFAKIREAFTKGEDEEIDFAKGLEYISQEAQKAADGLHTIADIVGTLGGSDEAVEKLNDIATSMKGVGTAAQGATQIFSGDYIGGAANVIKGTWTAVSTWLDNGDKKISKQVEESEKRVKALEIAYDHLQNAMEDAYGYQEVAAKRANIINKQLQLTELERQLLLEKSRKRKHQDANRIMELQKAIIDLRDEIANSTKDIVNDLLGISSVGDAAEQVVSAMIDAFKQGEDYMKVYEDSFQDMIDNLIVKAIAGEVVGRKIQAIFDAVEKASTQRADQTYMDVKDLLGITGRAEDAYASYFMGWRIIPEFLKDLKNKGAYKDVIASYTENIAEATALGYGDVADLLQKRLDAILEGYAKEATIRPEDVQEIRDLAQAGVGEVNDLFTSLVESFGIKFGEGADKSLSNLQQGIQGITEDTAGALEAYMNGVSQQVYLQSDILTQIRDAVVSFDLDVQTATISQILLQLQQSYAVQMAIQSILVGWSNPSGQAVRVELAS